jgi:hypothetical protein
VPHVLSAELMSGLPAVHGGYNDRGPPPGSAWPVAQGQQAGTPTAVQRHLAPSKEQVGGMGGASGDCASMAWTCLAVVLLYGDGLTGLVEGGSAEAKHGCPVGLRPARGAFY